MQAESVDLSHPNPAAGTSRRTAVRAAAWAVPVVSVAAAAPASAATSATKPQLVVKAAQFWVQSAGKTNFWVVPGFSVYNPGPVDAGGVLLTLRFAASDFWGVVPHDYLPLPKYNNIAALPGDGSGRASTTPPVSGDTVIDVVIKRDSGPAPAATMTIGTFLASANPGALTWQNNPKVQTVPFTLQPFSSQFGVTAGVLTRVAQPTGK